MKATTRKTPAQSKAMKAYNYALAQEELYRRDRARRGGKREGAGRKTRDTPREAITVRLESQDTAKLRDLCAAKGLSQADWITRKIRMSRL